MISHYLKFLYRLLAKQKVLTFINVVGLAVGMATCMIIGLYVRHELSYDKFYTQAKNLYRVELLATDPAGVTNEGAALFYPIATMLAENFPAFLEVARLRPHTTLISRNEVAFLEDGFRLVDDNFFRLFDVTWLAGSPEKAFQDTTDVVLTASTANRYFGVENPLGQTLTMAEGIDLRVTGIIKDLPDNTHLSGSMFAAMSIRDIFEPVATRTADWYTGIYYTYALLQPGSDAQAINQALDAFSKANLPTVFNTTFSLFLDPITDIHLNPKIGDLKAPGNTTSIVIFSTIGFAILLIACINFMNLTTVRSAQRSGEIGLRLTFGAGRYQLVRQFLGETFLLTFMAFLMAMACLELLLPGLQSLLGITFDMSSFWRLSNIGLLILAVVVSGVLAGWYPALVQSSLRPAVALRRVQPRKLKRLALRNLLVVLQFSIATILIISTISIFAQMDYARNLDMGFHSDRVLVLRTSDSGSRANIRLLKQQVMLQAGIDQATLSYSTPLRNVNRIFVFAATDNDQTQHRMAYLPVDFDYFDTFDIALVSGRFFSENRPTDLIGQQAVGENAFSGSYILNVAGAREFGWTPDEAVGKVVSQNGRQFRVIGVVGNTVESAQIGVFPSIYVIPAGVDPGRYLSVRLNARNMANTLQLIDSIWASINSAEPVDRMFLDQRIQQLYQGEEKQMDLALYFSAIAILLSCMGLFGLSAYTAERRTKEIGVRKVMGGSVWSIVLLLTNDFSRLVLVSNVIAWPVAYFAMNRWLANFAYRIDLTPMIFIGSGLIALCIAWVTVGGTAAKAASRKPVLALRYE